MYYFHVLSDENIIDFIDIKLNGAIYVFEEGAGQHKNLIINLHLV